MQEINFYNSLSKPGLYEINAKRAKIILTVWISILILISILQSVYMGIQKTRLAYLSHKEQSLTHQIETLIKNSPKIKQANALEETILAFSEKIAHKNTFIQEIKKYNAQLMVFKPSQYLIELSKAIVPNMWLTSFSFDEQGKHISLQGMTLNSSQLTAFVAQLQKETDFRNRPFNKVIISNSDKQEQMSFVISTEENKKP